MKNHLVFENISELVEKLDNSETRYERDDSSDDDRDEDWADTDSYEDARYNLLYGKQYTELEENVAKYKTAGTATKRVNRLNVAGFQVVVPLYLQGIPNSMISQKNVIDNKIVTIFYAIQAVHNVKRKTLEEGAMKLFNNILSLESQGYRVNLYIIEVNKDSNGKFGWCLKLKNDRERFNVRKMGFPLLSSSMLRRIGFRIKERLYKDWIGAGYGHGRFDIETTDAFIKKHFGNIRYEIWNYEGKK